MLDFSVIQLSDRDRITRLLGISDFRGCEYCFANNFAWQRLYQTKITFYKDFYISCTERDGVSFTFPAGGGDYSDVFEQMRLYAEERGSALTVSSVTPDKFHIFEEIYGKENLEITPYEDGWDYVYSVNDLASLAGKKYHGKRNHLKKIYNTDFTYSELKHDDIDDCITFAANTYTGADRYDDKSFVAEQYAINAFLSHFDELGLKGGVIRIGGEVKAFTIGERINSDTFGTHIEKADGSIQGLYPAINNFFAKSLADTGILYINREEDLGIEGLRKAKRSYYPAFMIEKHTVKVKN